MPSQTIQPRVLVLLRAMPILLALGLSAFSSGLAAAASAPAPRAAEKNVDPHVAHTPFRFQDPSMDFVFGALLLGSTVNHGCEIGEAFATAATIQDGDAASWEAAWCKTAARLAARGERALARGHAVSARELFLRASNAYRMALVVMLPDDARFRETAGRSRSLMRRAGELMQPPLEYVEIPFEGTVLPGYFRRATSDGAPAKTLLMIGGAETYAEDQYFYIAPQALARGYNFLTVDLPGQGLLPLEGRYFRPDTEKPLGAVLDYACSRADVDPKRVALYGISSGGGFVGRAAAHDPRIAAVVMNNCVLDAGTGVAKMAVATATPAVMQRWSSFSRQSNQLIAWRFGVDMWNLPGLVAANRDFRFDPSAVSMPALVVVGGGEYESPEIARQTSLCLAGLPNPRKRLVLGPVAEGAANHCLMENRSLMSQEVFDWLDAIFKN